MSGLVSMAQQFSGLPMKSLIGGPLKAATDANGLMARTQTQFMLSTCFENGGNGGNNAGQNNANAQQSGGGKLTPIMVEFELKRPVISAKGEKKDDATITLKLPLLTLIPLNSLAVDDVKIHFEMEVSSSTSKDNETSNEQETAAKADITAKYNAGLFSVEVHGSVSHSSKSSSKQKEHYEASNKAKYEVDVHAGQLPLPTGVTTIINAFTKNIDPIIEKEQDS